MGRCRYCRNWDRGESFVPKVRHACYGELDAYKAARGNIAEGKEADEGSSVPKMLWKFILYWYKYMYHCQFCQAILTLEASAP